MLPETRFDQTSPKTRYPQPASDPCHDRAAHLSVNLGKALPAIWPMSWFIRRRYAHPLLGPARDPARARAIGSSFSLTVNRLLHGLHSRSRFASRGGVLLSRGAAISQATWTASRQAHSLPRSSLALPSDAWHDGWRIGDRSARCSQAFGEWRL